MDKPRRFSDLRERSTQKKDTALERAALAFHVIAASEHGDAIKNYMASIVFDTSSPENEGAWREVQARRKFAEEIINMMDGKYEHKDGG